MPLDLCGGKPPFPTCQLIYLEWFMQWPVFGEAPFEFARDKNLLPLERSIQFVVMHDKLKLDVRQQRQVIRGPRLTSFSYHFTT